VCALRRANRGHRLARQFNGASDVLPKHVTFEVHAAVNLRVLEICMLHGVWHELHVEAVWTKTRDRQTDTVYGNRPLVHDVRRQVSRKPHCEPAELRVWT